ncbi:outer membrane beta-barrel protein [Sediminitomix flava]|uniref:Outer membrane protein with beta-barrel domain n=1 Tax=Sediminitomix flava TaxID=379075 RepID=A0A315YXL0_SEDFL|nr:outer membrane beta-barrel protein [Sediminitomix flava]PWJ34217.1 outer membrane protein with beta-barrel domain [Sediminitomix flava]
MKKLFVSAIALFAFASTSFAQEKKVEFGLKAGANIAFVTTEAPNPYAKQIYGPMFGGFVNYNVSEKFAVQLDLLYSQQGIQVDGQPIEETDDLMAVRSDLDALPALTGIALPIDGQGTVSRYYTYNYLNIPLVAKYEVASGLKVMAGAQVGILLNANKNSSNNVSAEAIAGLEGNIAMLGAMATAVQGQADDAMALSTQMQQLIDAGMGDDPQASLGGATPNQVKAQADAGYAEATAGVAQLSGAQALLQEKGDDLLEEGDFDVTDSFIKTDVSLVFGAEYEMPSGLFFDARFNLGLSNVKANPADGEYVKNRAVQIGVGYKF